MITRQTVEIIRNEPISDGYHRIRLNCGAHYASATPGQFVTIRLPDQAEPLLRRPFSIHRLPSEDADTLQMEILYRVVGGFTRQLARQVPGNKLDMLGPIGHGFSVRLYEHPVAVAAGGIGVAPLAFLAERLKQAGMDMNRVMVFLGGRTGTDILCEGIFSGLGMQVSVATEDGTAGEKGLVTEPLQEWIKDNNPKMIYACGPHPMLKAVGEIAQSHGIACEVSIETLMACGLGVCMGCAVSTNDAGEGYRHVCKDGPVFDARVIV